MEHTDPSQIKDSAAQAAALIRSTADSTANALNIQYIQRDILEIKSSIKEIGTNSVSRLDFNEHLKTDADHEIRIRSVEKVTENLASTIKFWGIAMGVAFTILQIALKYFLK